MKELRLSLPEDHRGKLIAPLDSQTPLCYMSVIHLKAVTAIVNEIFDETVMFDLFLPYPKGTEQN